MRTPTSEFGRELRRARQERGWTLGSAAEMVGCSLTHLSDIELGRRSPPDEKTVRTMAQVLELDADRLLRLAARARGAVQVSSERDRVLEVAQGLARYGDRMDEDTLARLEEIISAWRED